MQTDRAQQDTAEPAGGPDATLPVATHETERIMRTAAIWTAAGALVPAVGLGPLVGAGWRPWVLPVDLAVVWWVGAAAAGLGLALLIWAGCPVLGDSMRNAHLQKLNAIRIGVVMNLGGIAIAGLAVLLSPVGT